MSRHLLVALALSYYFLLSPCHAQVDVELQVNQAREARLSGNYDQSASQLRSIVTASPGHFRAHYNLALALALKGDAEAADPAFKRALELLSSEVRPDYSVFNSYGWFLMQSGRLDEAEQQFSMGMKHLDSLSDGSRSRLLNNFGILKLQLDQVAAAGQLFERSADQYGNRSAQRNLRVAENIMSSSSQWTLVFGADRTVEAANDEQRKAVASGISNPFVVQRDRVFRSVASFESRSEAEAALAIARGFRPDAYIVSWEAWCGAEGSGSRCQRTN